MFFYNTPTNIDGPKHLTQDGNNLIVVSYSLVLVRYSHTVEVLTVPDCLQDGGREEFGIVSLYLVLYREGLCVCCNEIV